MFRITITPFDGQGARRRGLFSANLDARLFCISRQPVRDGACVLIREGIDPTTPIAIRHAGADFDVMTSTVGSTAKWTVEDAASVIGAIVDALPATGRGAA